MEQVDAGPPVVNGNTTGATLAIKKCKLYVPVVSLSKNDEIKLLKKIANDYRRS